MTERPSSSNQLESNSEDRLRERFPAGYHLHEPFMLFWPNVIKGIAIGGALWPFAAYLLSLLEDISVKGLGPGSILEILVGGSMVLVLGGAICFFVVMLVAFGVVMGVDLILKTLQVDCEHLVNGMIAGGIVGLILGLPTCLVEEISYLKCLWVIGSATVLAQCGGAWGAWQALRANQSATEIVQVFPKTIHFGVRQIMIFTIWCSLILTVLKWLGALNERLLIIVSMWAALQLAGLAALLVLHRKWLEHDVENSST